jgi:SAM-dependent methyltransferase
MSRLGNLRRKIAARALRLGGHPEVPGVPADYLSPAELRARLSARDLRIKAENYFAGLTDWTDQLRKPFSRIEDAPHMLVNFAVVLEGLDLAPGMTVLDFAAGSCWASDILAALGCRVIALDVSMTGLMIGRERTRTHPMLAGRAAPGHVVFDGAELPLGDGSVDRIFCFDAFHHVVDQKRVLEEMSRVLVDGGIAAFGEPGPHHSRSPQSQLEMKNYSVLEDDLDLEQLWPMAETAGFTDIRLSLFNAAPPKVSLSQFSDFLAGGETAVTYVDDSRRFLANVRDFFLYKGTERVSDSRKPFGLLAEVRIELDNPRPKPGETIRGRATVTNRGTAKWLPSRLHFGGVSLGCHLFRESGELVDFDYHWTALARHDGQPIEPGDTVRADLAIPGLERGTHLLEFDLVSNEVCWFGQRGSQTVRLRIEVEALL